MKARSVKRMRESESWSWEEIEKFNIPTWKAQLGEGEVQLEEREEGEEVRQPVARTIIPRDFNIKQAHLEKFGYSENCGRCSVLRRGGTPTMHHTIKCRDRIRKLLEESENQDVLDRAAQRQSEYVAKQVQAAAEAGNS